VVADNQLSLYAGWDMDILEAEINDHKLVGFDIDLHGFDQGSLDEMFTDYGVAGGVDNPYSEKIKIPIYEPQGEKPSLEELYDDKKSTDLIEAIKSSKLNEKEKQFLMSAASRHIVFDYAKIANFYAHSSAECQGLMENSALVIIDFESAIKNGFAKLTDEIDRMFQPDEGEPGSEEDE